MAQSKVSQKENTPLGGGHKKGKQAGGAQQKRFNSFASIADDDGNPKNAKEYDQQPHGEDELFFVVNEELEGDERKIAQDRVDLLNYIHDELYYKKVARVVPAPSESRVDDTEIYHQGDYNGRKIDVGVHFYQGNNGVWTARAFAKFADADLSEDEYGVTIWADHAANASEVRKDKGSKIVASLSKFYWAPRWNYVLRYLRERMEAYNRDGSKATELAEPAAPGVSGIDGFEDDNDPTEIEEPMEFPSGCTGIIIGAKGASLNELKAKSGIKEIQMPEKTEPRPKARELVTLTFKGRKSAVNKAREMIAAIVQEWRNAPRPDRNGGGDGGFQQSIEGFSQPGGFDQVQEGSGDNDADAGGDSWADSANANAAATADWSNGGGGKGW
ncbi:hypothetical protein WAI453_004679 [Rhynchosporium graminicola]